MSYNTTEGTTEDINHNTTEDTQQTSQPGQSDQPSVAVVAVEEDDSSLPPELSGFSAEYINDLREYAALDECTLLEAHEYQQRLFSNREKKLAWRREREKSGMHNRPTAAYRPKPLY